MNACTSKYFNEPKSKGSLRGNQTRAREMNCYFREWGGPSDLLEKFPCHPGQLPPSYKHPNNAPPLPFLPGRGGAFHPLQVPLPLTSFSRSSSICRPSSLSQIYDLFLATG